jgi:hypothetical protein
VEREFKELELSIGTGLFFLVCGIFLVFLMLAQNIAPAHISRKTDHKNGNHNPRDTCHCFRESLQQKKARMGTKPLAFDLRALNCINLSN